VLEGFYDLATYAAHDGVPCSPLHFHAAAIMPVMSGNLIGRLLLAFALLWSQQAALSHSLSHLVKVQANRAVINAGGKPVKSHLKDQSCAECLSHAQYFAALGSANRSAAAVIPVSLRLVLSVTPDACIVTECMFQSRAPPPA
jgi:hypothetical protein